MRRRFTDARLLCALCLGLVACADLPDPPHLTDLSYLTESFDEPDGRLPSEGTEEVLEAVSEYLGIAYSLDGLTLLTNTMYDTSRALEDAVPSAVKAQGKIKAETACSGDLSEAGGEGDESDAEDSADAEDEEPENGTLAVTMGISESRIQRGVAGEARDCRFVSMRGRRRVVTLTADIQADYGRDIEIGKEPEGFLTVQLTNIDVRTDDGLAVSDLDDEYNFRVVHDDAIEILVDSGKLGVTDYGELVLISYTDGSTGFRDSRGEWHCSQDGECEFTRR